MITKNHISYLSKSDSILKKIIKENKIPKISKSEDYVLDLYKYIIFQQIIELIFGSMQLKMQIWTD